MIINNQLLRSLIYFLIWCSVLLGACLAEGTGAGTAEPKGLYVRNGVLMKQGKPYRGIGANYPSLFSRLLRDKNDTSSLRNLELLGKAHIPFLRFMAGGFRPEIQRLYLDDRTEFFRRMDQVVHGAEQSGVGLIPSLCFRVASMEELAGEEPSQLGNPNSKTNRLICRFTEDVVRRYSGSPAIWAWEFGNEGNNIVDLPKRGTLAARPGNRLSGRAAQPSPEVRLTSQQLRTAYVLFAQTIRKIDPWRPIDPGTSVPRPSAWHNAHGQFWKRDSPEQSLSILLDLTPNPMNMISVHVYQSAERLFPGRANTVSEAIALLMRFATEAAKPLFIGEFPTRDRPQAEEFLRAIQTNHVPLSTFWVFDNPSQEGTMNVDFHNERSFVFDLVAKANEALQPPAPGNARQ